ncbi:response regulator transcription factor [Dyella nitratireducens]|uniref:DNA-binding response regulator n=1 Tax=Dyella nitratireducens TaxID=1849580 RepID=A0ABQ1FJQ1_9GAMM|nr:response regulator transcription factor [Dyella nitratireducens]GGA18845.1 DNA-binding response regulator [Dyella nitratireducens]GLQ44600.1 DNA-binding response regulator [Dyella nitratireducens]
MDGFSLRVVLADDHPGMIAGVEYRLSSVSTIQLTGTAGNSTELIRILDTGCCDVLVSDYSMPGNEHGDGIAFFSFLQRRYPSVKLVVLTMLDNPAVLSALQGQGIVCIVSKSDAVSHLIPAIHAAATGGTYYSPSIEKSMSLRDMDRRGGNAPQPLSKRELEVLRLYASGLTINEIAERVSRSKKTISTQKARAMQKLGIERDVDLLRYAMEHGIVASSSQPGAPKGS